MSAPLKHASVEELWSRLAGSVRPGPAVPMPAVQAVGYVLAEDVRSGGDFPPFDRAMMDGYALRAADAPEPGARLRRTGLVRAGDAELPRVEPGTCVRINTGAPIPPGADAVIMVEYARVIDDATVEFERAARPGQHIQPAGALVRSGDVVARAGSRIDAGVLAAIVSAGKGEVRVFPRPACAIVSTGDELARDSGPLAAGQIHDSNQQMLEQLAKRVGGEVIFNEHGPDEPDALRRVLARGLKADVLIITGGMSKGSHDLVPGVLESLGVQWLVTSLNLKPGKPTHIGRSRSGTWVLGLPGNPLSCAVTFELFGAMLIRRRAGESLERPAILAGRVTGPLEATGDRPLYRPGVWSCDDAGVVQVRPLPWRGSGDPFAMAGANALIQRPAGAPALEAGASVRFLPLVCAECSP